MNFETDRGLVASRARLHRRVAELDRRRLQPRLRARLPVARPPRARRTCRRLGAEIVLWSSEEFGFAEVSDAWASGSSIMPQKKNPDAAELLRAKAPRIVGAPGRAARRAARAAADLQQGHAGGQGGPVRRRRHARAVPAGGERHARGHRVPARAARRRGGRRADRRHRHRGSAGQARHPVPAGARHRRVAGARGGVERAPAVRALAGGDPAPLRRPRRVATTTCLRESSWLESKVSEGGTAPARVREQLAHARAELEGQPV